MRPVIDELLADARAQAAQRMELAEQNAKQLLDEARQRVGDALARAHEDGEADAMSAVTARRVAGRREGRALLLAAHREVYEELLVAAREAVRADSADWRPALEGEAKRILGPQAVIRDHPAGGITAEAGGRMLALTAAGLADRAVTELAGELGLGPT